MKKIILITLLSIALVLTGCSSNNKGENTPNPEPAENSENTQLSAPVLSSAKTTPKGIFVQWEKVKGANSYRLFYKGGDVKKWTKVADTNESSYLVSNLTDGVTYHFTVKCIDSNGDSASDADLEGIACTYYVLDTPVLSSKMVNDNIVVTWNAVEGAEKYRVYYRKLNEKDWASLGDTEDTEFTVENLEKGNTYCFTVRCVTSDGKKASGADSEGITIKY